VLELRDHQSLFALLAVLNSMTFDWIARRIVAGLHLNRFYLETIPLPHVDRRDIEQLAEYACFRTRAATRFSSLTEDDRELVPTARNGSAPGPALIEAIVARGYGLDFRAMMTVLSDDRSDRRGLWRYYAANPSAAEVAAESLDLLREAA
jgi:hypothetical protein